MLASRQVHQHAEGARGAVLHMTSDVGETCVHGMVCKYVLSWRDGTRNGP
jgi:hypothetical protein